MAILIGTDEAGYGPNLGPLVIAASAWEVPGEPDECDLYDCLSSSVCPSAAPDGQRIAIADSKQLFKQGGSLAQLELAVHSALGQLGTSARTWRELFTLVDPSVERHLSQAPWYAAYDEALPLDLSTQEVKRRVNELEVAMQTADVSLIAVRAAVVFPWHFNQRVEQLGSKGALLTERTLELVRDVLSVCPLGAADVQCDKHGGRNRYAAALQHIWPDSWIDIHQEGRAQSTYELPIDDRKVRFCFAAGGESKLPAALASMTAKYARELAMRAFNAFWRQEVANLRPTAGYPVDAKRFKEDIAEAQRRLQIEDVTLWRCK